MGIVPSRGSVDFQVLVKTGDVKGAGTNSNVYIVLEDEDGKRSREVLLDCTWRDDFEKGNEDSFTIRKVPNLGKLLYIELWRDRKGMKDDWFVEYVKVRQFTNANESNNNIVELNDTPSKRRSRKCELLPFPINRWIQPNRRYVFKLYDSVLPQDDLNIKQRKVEMQEKKEKYVYQEDASNTPRRVSWKKSERSLETLNIRGIHFAQSCERFNCREKFVFCRIAEICPRKCFGLKES